MGGAVGRAAGGCDWGAGDADCCDWPRFTRGRVGGGPAWVRGGGGCGDVSVCVCCVCVCVCVCRGWPVIVLRVYIHMIRKTNNVTILQ